MPIHEFGGDWTEQKLKILDDYLTAYCAIFKANERARHFQTIYVDAFAGTGLIEQSAAKSSDSGLFGEFSEPEAVRLLEGSAKRALSHPFDRYIFVERSPSRVADLEALTMSSAKREQITVRQGDANARLLMLVAETDWKKNRAVVFLDPYGMQVDWQTIEALAGTEAVDLWLLFPLGQAVMRLLQPTKQPPPKWQRALDRIFGTHDWIGKFYVTEPTPDLFDADRVSTLRIANWEHVASYLIERLGLVFEAVSPKRGCCGIRKIPRYIYFALLPPTKRGHRRR